MLAASAVPATATLAARTTAAPAAESSRERRRRRIDLGFITEAFPRGLFWAWLLQQKGEGNSGAVFACGVGVI
ncbi:hypothetical protein Ahu01nite_060730 [Winogradskya humida]|uniref:Uncharacterized protein n=1 Tax=Winogradskya humida TaxID=113566 RepID=A0ABQ3ZWK8_9ACTN|nr:hypothetical protein Ahu01nite_060730 [Actinoplanes humidus]